METRGNLNPGISAIPQSLTLAIGAQAKKLACEGRRIYSFAAGEPDFDTPEHIKAAAVAALEAGETKYAPSPGTANLRAAVADKLNNENRLPYRADQVVVSNGAKHSLFNVIFTLCEPGDEIIIPAPYWLSYPEMVNVAGGEPVYVRCSEGDAFKMAPGDLERAITPRTKAVIINSPSNPSGLVYTGPELRALAETAVAHGLYIISDEIYEKILYDGAVHVSPGSLSEDIFRHTITINGLSKAYSMTGWRLGYMAAPDNIARAVTALQSHTTSGANTFAQAAAVEALRASQESVSDMVATFAERRNMLHERLVSIKGVTCIKPMGAFYMLPNISEFGMDSVAFCRRLLDTRGVAAVPGIAFGLDTHIRLSYACSNEVIERGMDAMELFCSELT